LGLYALLPLVVALMVINVDANMSQSWHSILSAASVVAVCTLALSWIDRHPRLVERSGAGLSYTDENAPAPCGTRRFYPAFEDLYQPEPIQHHGLNGQE
jgi:hypothetical protein